MQLEEDLRRITNFCGDDLLENGAQDALLQSERTGRVIPELFQLNPELKDRVPTRLLRDEEVEGVGPELLGAARAFLAGG